MGTFGKKLTQNKSEGLYKNYRISKGHSKQDRFNIVDIIRLGKKPLLGLLESLNQSKPSI